MLAYQTYKKWIPEQKMLEWYTSLHETALHAYREIKPVTYIKAILQTIPHIKIEQPTSTSVVGYLKGKIPGKTIAIRADIDGICLKKKSPTPIIPNDDTLENNQHHAHTAMLLGAASVLSHMQANLAGTIKFIFQHGQEVNPTGAIELINSGVMDDVDMVFALHLDSNLPIGMVATNRGSLTASSDVFSLIIKQKENQSTASTLNSNNNPVTIGAEVVHQINQLLLQKINQLDPISIVFFDFSSQTQNNDFPNSAHLKANIRTVKQETRMYLKKKIFQVTKNICAIYDIHADAKYTLGYNPLMNDTIAFKHIIAAAQKINRPFFDQMQPLLISEDFSMYTDMRPGAFYFLGSGSNTANNCYESILKYGCVMHVQTIIESLNSTIFFRATR